jgi:hypothetical protein
MRKDPSLKEMSDGYLNDIYNNLLNKKRSYQKMVNKLTKQLINLKNEQNNRNIGRDSM